MKALYFLLRAGVCDYKIVDIDINFDWKFIEKSAVEQNVLPLILDGYRFFYERISELQVSGFRPMPAELMLQWYAGTQQAERHYTEHLTAIRTMTEYLAEKNFKVMILKGYSLSLCYPKPSHRPCGDIDIYCFGDFKKVDELVSSLSLCEVDRSHHHHTVFRWNGIKVENHYDFVNQHTHKTNKRLEPILKKLATEGYEEKDGVILPSPNLSALFVLVHTASHFAAQSITLRHLVDWYLLKKHYEDKIDWNFIKKTCIDLGYNDFLEVWEELSSFLFDENSDFNEERLSIKAKKVLNEILHPKYGNNVPEKSPERELYLLRRWFSGRWKMKLVYTKENLFEQLCMHIHSYFIKPESLLK